MFCKVTTNGKTVMVGPSQFGRFLTWLTCGRYMPTITFRRDFGSGSKSGECLHVAGKCHVIVDGDLISSRSSIHAAAVVSGDSSYQATWEKGTSIY